MVSIFLLLGLTLTVEAGKLVAVSSVELIMIWKMMVLTNGPELRELVSSQNAPGYVSDRGKVRKLGQVFSNISLKLDKG